MNENLLKLEIRPTDLSPAGIDEQRLERMRQTSRGKVRKTLQTRFASLLETVSKQLESSAEDLEMRTVARDVGALNKVLSGTQDRGILDFNWDRL